MSILSWGEFVVNLKDIASGARLAADMRVPQTRAEFIQDLFEAGSAFYGARSAVKFLGSIDYGPAAGVLMSAVEIAGVGGSYSGPEITDKEREQTVMRSARGFDKWAIV